MISISIIEKSKGALLASAIGDALGWPNEQNSGNKSKSLEQNYNSISFSKWFRRNKYPFWHVETILPGEYSDDTQLSLAVSRSLKTQNWIEHLAYKEFPFWLKYERGAGRASLRSAMLLKKRIKPWNSNKYVADYLNAGGNGGAMRILPHVVYKHDSSIKSIIDDVIEDVILTHGHPRAILGATCYAVALHYLFKKQDILQFGELPAVLLERKDIWGALPNKDRFGEWLEIASKKAEYNYYEEWNSCYRQMHETLSYIQYSLQDGLLSEDTSILDKIGAYSIIGGSGSITVLSAVYLFSKYSSSPQLGVQIPAFLYGVDTDTIASITGGLLGSFLGDNWIPTEWKLLQDYEYIISVAAELCGLSYNKSEDNKDVNDSSALISTDIGFMELLCETKASSKSSIIISKYRLSFGQTIYIKNTLGSKTKSNYKRNDNDDKQIASNNSIVQLPYDLFMDLVNDEELGSISLMETGKIMLLYKDGNDPQMIARKLSIKVTIINKLIEFINNYRK